jgi:pilus assembly protein Flp/PilA
LWFSEIRHNQQFLPGGKAMLNIFVSIKLAIAAIQATLNQRFGVESQKGVTLIEYALIAALIAVAVITALRTVGTDLNTLFGDIATAL